MRTAPLIDKRFKVKYEHLGETKTSREIALGMARYDRLHEAIDPFDEADKMSKTKTKVHME